MCKNIFNLPNEILLIIICKCNLNNLLCIFNSCLEIKNNNEINKQINRLNNLSYLGPFTIQMWKLQTYEIKILKQITNKLLQCNKITKQKYLTFNLNSLCEFDKSIDWGISSYSDNTWRDLFKINSIYNNNTTWTIEELEFLRDYYNIYSNRYFKI